MQIGVETSRAVENKRIFVVDSDEITRAALQFMLHDENETHEIPGVEEAYAKAAEWKPDLILLGMALASTETLAEIGQRIPGAKILLIADAEGETAARRLSAVGAHGILVKPLRLEAVRSTVDVALGRAKAFIPLQVLTPKQK